MKLVAHKAPYFFTALLLICAMLQGCAYYPLAQGQSQAPGDRVLSALNKQKARSAHEISNTIRRNLVTASLPDNVEVALQAYPDQAAALFRALQQTGDLQEALVRANRQMPQKTDALVYLALSLYPDQKKDLLETLALNDEFSEKDILDAALLARLDPGQVFPATAAEGKNSSIVPLFHSASITLFEQQERTQTEVEFRPVGSESWQVGLPLQWEPIRQALSGSLVKLTPDTEYEVKITLLKGDSPIGERHFQFKTRVSTPPINPDLVYRLEDIYTGGRLDLEALNISGSADGWAKIIGDPNTPIIPSEGDYSAVRVGDQSYIMFENITVKGGRIASIATHGAHHLWFNGCNLSGWGRTPTVFKQGKGYEKESDTKPINYDAAFSFYKTGVVVVENCQVHSPNYGSNSWKHGHPRGASAMLVMAKHKKKAYQGQYVVRNNRFFGTAEKRFNDVIESRANGRIWGGFLRDSAIHDNYIAYANDDLIEIDGGQSNVLIYNNELEQGYCGISAIPNMLGPSYIFNNHIHNLGDARGKSWGAIKLGGLNTAPAGLTLIFENLIENVATNGIVAARFKGDTTFWTHAQNNIMLTETEWSSAGFGVLDKTPYAGSSFINNLVFNKKLGEGKVSGNVANPFVDEQLDTPAIAESIFDSEQHHYLLPLNGFTVPNFSTLNQDGLGIIGIIKDTGALEQ